MTVTLWLLALLLGVRHAFEPDHLAAVAVLVSGKAGTRGGVRLGATWGLGHAAALFVVATILTAARATMRESVGDAFEVAVGVILIVLGAWRIATAFGRIRQRDPHAHAPADTGRPFWIGIAHGLAGSGALTAIAASQVPSAFLRLAYVAVFGIGAIAGMMALSGIAGRLLERLAHRPAVMAGLGAATGGLAVVLGFVWLIRFAV
jgi:hypothetical protein